MPKIVLAGAVAGSLVLLTACGGNDFAESSVKEIQAASLEDMKALDSMRLDGSVNSGGQEISLDIALNTAGDCTGTIGVDEGTAELVKEGDTAWFRPDEAFWRAQGGPAAQQIIDLVGDKWVVLPADQQQQFAGFCDLDELLAEIEDDDNPDGKVEGTEDVDGQEAVRVSSTNDEGDPTQVWVATEDPHYILKAEVTGGEEPGSFTFSDFNEDINLQAPAEEDTIDFSELIGAGS